MYVNVGLPSRTDSVIGHSPLNGTANSVTNSTNLTPTRSILANGRLYVRRVHVASVCPGERQTLTVGSFIVLYQFVLANDNVQWQFQSAVSVCPGERQTMSSGSFKVLYQFVLSNGELGGR